MGWTQYYAEPASGQSVQRYYDPAIGRFLSVDPVTAYGGSIRHFNRYAYTYNNPYSFPTLMVGVLKAVSLANAYGAQ